jgi:hypothetical protein
MAISQGDLWLLQQLREQGYLPDQLAIADIGAQEVSGNILDNRDDLLALGETFGVRTSPPTLVGKEAGKEGEGQHRLAGKPMAREIWHWLGADYVAIDVDGSANAVALDLNYDAVPASERASFALVTNFGTTEHVANQANAFKIIHDLTAVGGMMIHNVPCHLLNHGLINYSPKFFWALARANDYKNVYLRARPEDDPESVHVAFQKQHDLEFVTPLDLPDMATTDNAVLKERYWTIFDRQAIEAIARVNETRLLRRAVARRFPWLVRMKRRLFSS